MDTLISIITVTYNSAATLADTIESVLGQQVKPYEYIIIDGKSTDNTVEIANSYKSRMEDAGIRFIVVSEPDNGIYDAMNKGIRLAGGEIVGIINSDDWYENNALAIVKQSYEKEQFDLFYADLRMIRPDGSSFVKHSRNRKYATSRDWNHPTSFITKAMYDRFTYKNDTIHDDYDLILRIKKSGARIVVVNEVIADFRMNGVSHVRSVKKAAERMKIKYRIYRQNGYSRLYFFECFLVEVAKLIIG